MKKSSVVGNKLEATVGERGGVLHSNEDNGWRYSRFQEHQKGARHSVITPTGSRKHLHQPGGKGLTEVDAVLSINRRSEASHMDRVPEYHPTSDCLRAGESTRRAFPGQGTNVEKKRHKEKSRYATRLT